VEKFQALEKLRECRLVFTVTSGRSGSKLLTQLASKIPDIKAVHEGRPRMNYVMRGIQGYPEAAKWWLESEMYPTIAAELDQPVYLETSHLFCKGFVEPTLELGLKPQVILLTRPPNEVAASLYSIDCIPERTCSGRLVLLGPSDPGVWKIPAYETLSDYQLCYWYAREIERRQAHYARVLPKQGCACLNLSLADLTDASRFIDVARFLTGKSEPGFDQLEIKAVLQSNQNPKSGLASTSRTQLGAAERADEETFVDQLMAQHPVN